MPNYALGITVKDYYKRKTARSFLITGIDFVTALANAAAFITDYEAITEGNVIEYRLAEVVPNSDSVVVGASVDAGVTFSVSISGIPNKTAAVKVPMPEPAIFQLESPMVNLANALVTAFESHFTSGVVLVSDGEVVGDFLSGKLDK